MVHNSKSSDTFSELNIDREWVLKLSLALNFIAVCNQPLFRLSGCRRLKQKQIEFIPLICIRDLLKTSYVT
uniref:Uncharacterized protein n=1 Tax=Strigamia maritima TaxID=126957 RepID=T1JLW8_STRMM